MGAAGAALLVVIIASSWAGNGRSTGSHHVSATTVNTSSTAAGPAGPTAGPAPSAAAPAAPLPSVDPALPRAYQPNPDLTPGSAATDATQPVVCVGRYAAASRDVTEDAARQVFAGYGIDYGRHGGYELDHLVPLELGGDNSSRNLWPEPAAGPLGAAAKDRLENHLHDLVCAGQVPLADAQHAMATDWFAASHLYGPQAVRRATPPAEPAPPAAGSSAPSSDGTYTNSDGNQVSDPVPAGARPAGATARCRDGEYSFSQHRSGTCSGHGGVAQWY